MLTSAEQNGLNLAIDEATSSMTQGGIPVGAVLLGPEGNVVAQGHNRRVQDGDPIAHGEMVCLRAAGRRSSYAGMTLITTLAPCAMCAGACQLFGMPRVVVGEAQNFAGELDRLRTHAEVVLVGDERCVQLMARFQRESPQLWAEDIAVQHA